MPDHEPTEAPLGRLSHQLDDLAARATRAVADLRVRSQSILDDVASWTQDLDRARVDAELARMDARDELHRARAAWDEQQVRITRRFDQAREDAADAVHVVRGAMERALRDLGTVLDPGDHVPK